MNIHPSELLVPSQSIQLHRRTLKLIKNPLHWKATSFSIENVVIKVQACEKSARIKICINETKNECEGTQIANGTKGEEEKVFE